jgi:Calcineurin-like phosphoesterase/Iron/zinc purple acid phosphatase-like protein C
MRVQLKLLCILLLMLLLATVFVNRKREHIDVARSTVQHALQSSCRSAATASIERRQFAYIHSFESELRSAETGQRFTDASLPRSQFANDSIGLSRCTFRSVPLDDESRRRRLVLVQAEIKNDHCSLVSLSSGAAELRLSLCQLKDGSFCDATMGDPLTEIVVIDDNDDGGVRYRSLASVARDRQEQAAIESRSGNACWLRRTVVVPIRADQRTISIGACTLHRDASPRSGDDALPNRVRRVHVSSLIDERLVLGAKVELSKQPLVLRIVESGERDWTALVAWETNGVVVARRHQLFRYSIGGGGEWRSLANDALDVTYVDDCHVVYKARVVVPHNEVMRFCVLLPRSRRFSVRMPARHESAREATFDMAVVGDNQYGAPLFRGILSALAERHGVPDLLLHVGDAVDHWHDVAEWHRYLWSPLETLGDATRARRLAPLLLARGNHCADRALSYAYTAGVCGSHCNTDEWQSMSLASGALRLIVVDTNCPSELCPAQLRWLRAELASARRSSARFVVVALHMPPFVEMWEHDGVSGEPFVRRDWVPLFEEFRVDLVVGGHSHTYMRGERNGVRYVITGGAGGNLDYDTRVDWNMYSVRNSQHHFGRLTVVDARALRWRAYSADASSILDEFVIERNY